MNFSECSLPIQKSCKPKISNQGMFVFKLFEALDCNPTNALRYSDHDYEKKLCNGSKKLTDKMKKDALASFSEEKLSNFCFENIQDSNLQNLSISFGFSKSIIPDKKMLSLAIARQYHLIFTSKKNDVENIIISEYQKIEAGHISNGIKYHKALYDGDSANRISSIEWIDAKTYEVIQVKINILNSGSVPWINRRLIFKQEKTSCPIPKAEREINISDIEPNNYFTKTIEFETRGSEGEFVCHYIMQDSDGNDCFPNRNTFDIRIKVTFIPD